MHQTENYVVMRNLEKQKATLEIKIKEKCKELKQLCIAEAELTGIIPMEIPLEPNESPPKIRRRMGTMYPYNDEVISTLLNKRAMVKTGSPKRKALFCRLTAKSEELLNRKPSTSDPVHHTWSPKKSSPKKSRLNSYLKSHSKKLPFE